MRYFINLQYNGSSFSGWQRQPNAMTVQETIEKALSNLLRSDIQITGCGRTDAGVHASQYYAHFDHMPIDTDHIRFKLDQMIGNDIYIENIFEVPADTHARFSAERRAYHYFLSGKKHVFSKGFYWHYPLFHKVDWAVVNELTAMITQFEEFKPFCKSDSGLDSFKCLNVRADWEMDPHSGSAIFHIESNRFLRGMVRLIVGTCMYAGNGKLSIDQVKTALEEQSPLVKAYAAPPEGLFLSMIEYPFIESNPPRRPTNFF